MHGDLRLNPTPRGNGKERRRQEEEKGERRQEHKEEREKLNSVTTIKTGIFMLI